MHNCHINERDKISAMKKKTHAIVYQLFAFFIYLNNYIFKMHLSFKSA